MPIRDILSAFEGEEALPIDLKKVTQWILDRGIQDEIEFVGVELDVGVIRGYLHRFRYRRQVYSDPVNAANVYYATNQEPDWINIVCGKELIHLMDGGNTTSTKVQFDQLVKRLVLPRVLDNFLEDPGHVLIDRMGDVVAAALLLPVAARTRLKPALERGELNANDIAKLALIPVQYVRMVMSERWDKAYETFKKF